VVILVEFGPTFLLKTDLPRVRKLSEPRHHHPQPWLAHASSPLLHFVPLPFLVFIDSRKR
jgi:hypothetical protein